MDESDTVQAPEWVDDPTVPLTDDEGRHYLPQLAGDARLDPAMVRILAVRALHTVEEMAEALAETNAMAEDASALALAHQAGMFIAGARWLAGRNGLDQEVAAEEAGNAFTMGLTDPGELIEEEAAQRIRGLRALAGYARLFVAVCVLATRYTRKFELSGDERELLERAFEYRVPTEQAGFAQALLHAGTLSFLEKLEEHGLSLVDDEVVLVKWDDERVVDARQETVRLFFTPLDVAPAGEPS